VRILLQEQPPAPGQLRTTGQHRNTGLVEAGASNRTGRQTGEENRRQSTEKNEQEENEGRNEENSRFNLPPPSASQAPESMKERRRQTVHAVTQAGDENGRQHQMSPRKKKGGT
jgi:hypothetical protein